MPSKVQLTGGLFQDSEGNPLVNGYLKFKLSQDGSVTGVGSICAGIEITVQLNSSGSVDTVTPQYIWGNDQILPVNTFYKVTGYTAQGQPAWGPNNQQVIGNGGTFDVGTWVPNQMFSWTPPLTSTLFKTNGVANSVQSILNLIGAGVSASGGDITIASGAGNFSAVDITSAGNGGTFNLTSNQANSNVIRLFDDGSLSTTVTVKFPSGTPGIWMVENYTNATITLTTTDVGASSVKFFSEVLVYSEGTLDSPGIYYASIPASWQVNVPFVVGKPASGLQQSVTFVNMAGDNQQLVFGIDGTTQPVVYCEVAPTSNQTFTIEVNNALGSTSFVTWGTCTIPAGQRNSISFTPVAGAAIVAPNVMRVTYPNPQDATMAGVAVGVFGTFATLPH